MNSPSNMSDLFNKLDDLKHVFRYGERLIPIIQSLIDFMKDTVPLLDKINNSIAESTNKIPKASDKINDVTNATELATTEILDLVDFISSDVNKIEAALKNIIENEEEKKNLRQQLLAKISPDKDTSELLSRYFELTDISSTVFPLMDLFKKIKDDAYSITISLQVQDITSQQLSAVNHLIESVQDKLSSLLFNFQETGLQQSATKDFHVPRNANFNPDASYTKSDKQQKVADSLIRAGVLATQDEIDKLFK